MRMVVVALMIKMRAFPFAGSALCVQSAGVTLLFGAGARPLWLRPAAAWRWARARAPKGGARKQSARAILRPEAAARKADSEARRHATP